MRAFDGKIRQWHDGMGDECYCQGKKVVLDSDDIQTYCVCNRDGWPERCRRVSRIPEDTLDRFTFETWVRDLNPAAWGHKQIVERYAGKDVVPSPWLVMFGSVGTGKTHLMIALVGLMASRGVSVVYYTAYDMEAELREAIDTNDVGAYIRRMATVPVLVIDDLGTEMTSSEFVSGAFFRILNERHQSRRRTVIAFNPDGYEKQDARLRSRLTDAVVCQVLEFNGPDVRPTLRLD